MKNQKLEKGKRLDKKMLKEITGGLGNVRCTNSSGYCQYIGPGCAEQKCQLPEPLEAIDDISL